MTTKEMQSNQTPLLIVVGLIQVETFCKQFGGEMNNLDLIGQKETFYDSNRLGFEAPREGIANFE